jgi:NAD-dependent dihydropyrimidine dehydrogenase PreA subunit
MSLEKLADKFLETDVLVVGGGIGGCPLAAKAAEQGLRVTLIEKSKTDRSGNAAHGMDHYGVFPHGISTLETLKLWEGSRHRAIVNGPGRFVNQNIDYVLTDKGFWTLDELERLGIPMRWDDGELYWVPHQLHVRGLKLGLRVHWERIKPKMAEMVRKKGVNVLDRVMITDLLTNNGKVVGATAINTRTGEFIVIKAAVVVMATGMFCRCFDPEGPLSWKYKFNYHYCPATTSGDGWAIAYRAGVGIAHMDLSAWGFRVRDNLTISFGSFVSNDGIPSKVFDWKGDEAPITSRITPQGYDEAERVGLTPMYQSLEHLPDDFQKRLEVAYADEYLFALKMAGDRGFNPRTHRYAFMTRRRQRAGCRRPYPDLCQPGRRAGDRRRAGGGAEAGGPGPPVGHGRHGADGAGVRGPLHLRDLCGHLQIRREAPGGSEAAQLAEAGVSAQAHGQKSPLPDALPGGPQHSATGRFAHPGLPVPQGDSGQLRPAGLPGVGPDAGQHADPAAPGQRQAGARIGGGAHTEAGIHRGGKVTMPGQLDYHRGIGCKKLPKVTYEDECWHCGVCWAECPKRAINITYPACLW